MRDSLWSDERLKLSKASKRWKQKQCNALYIMPGLPVAEHCLWFISYNYIRDFSRFVTCKVFWLESNFTHITKFGYKISIFFFRSGFKISGHVSNNQRFYCILDSHTCSVQSCKRQKQPGKNTFQTHHKSEKNLL